MIERFIDWTERGRIPDGLVRFGIRRLLKKRLSELGLDGSAEQKARKLQAMIEEFSAAPVALVPEKANEQHYEVPAELFRLTLGRRLKYSSCVWQEGVETLDQAEEAALFQTCQRAELEDGMSILELGCGWGSLSLWMAEKHPNARITSVSNSASQREYIVAQAKDRGVDKNLRVVTCDINDFSTDHSFDRVVSVEMFEHVRNHRLLFQRISNWLKPEGKMFVHIFCHNEMTYKFQDEKKTDWMSRYFFSGGMMPGKDLFSHYDGHLAIENQWEWDGTHYQKTAEAWLANMDANQIRVREVLKETYGTQDAVRWFNRWRMFYLAVSELFGYREGTEWLVGHYLFKKRNR